MEYFKEECAKFSKIGLQIAKMWGLDQEHDVTKYWEEKTRRF